MRLGFACAWEAKPEVTWSNTPWSLRRALREYVDLVDVGLSTPLPVRLSLKALHARRHAGSWVSLWKHSRAAQRYSECMLRRGEKVLAPDLTLQIQDLAVLDTPYLVLQDLSYDLLLDSIGETGRMMQFPTLGDDHLKRLRDRQLRVYENAAGVLAMSSWFAEHLIRVTGLPAQRVHVVHPGASAVDALTWPVSQRDPDRPRRRLLFVGRDFARKGGEQVVAALVILRREVDPDISLTIIGPDRWPMPGTIPDGVHFLSRLPMAEVAAEYDQHDVFVMPSRFEAFGIALVEALARGLPCVARDAFAMPEIVRPGDNGELVSTDSPAELAAALAGVLANDAMCRRVADQATDTIRYFSWHRAAQDIAAIASGVPTHADVPAPTSTKAASTKAASTKAASTKAASRTEVVLEPPTPA